MGLFDKLNDIPGNKRGRPRKPEPLPAPVPVNFEQALALLSEDECQFVKAFVTDPTKGASGAWLAANPGAVKR